MGHESINKKSKKIIQIRNAATTNKMIRTFVEADVFGDSDGGFANTSSWSELLLIIWLISYGVI